MGSIALCFWARMGCRIHSVLLKALALALNQGHEALKMCIHCMTCCCRRWVLAHVVCRMGGALWWGPFRSRLLEALVQ